MAQSRTKTRLAVRGVLKTLVVAGAVGTALVAPNATALIDRHMKRIDKKNARRTLSYLKYKRLVEARQKNGQYEYRLTSRGYDRYQKMVFDELAVKTPQRWDKKWRLVMFDIPIAKNNQRKILIEKLRMMDFYLLQQSAWLHPFNCEKEIGALLSYLQLEKHVSLLVVETGNFTDHATKHFQKTKLLV